MAWIIAIVIVAVVGSAGGPLVVVASHEVQAGILADVQGAVPVPVFVMDDRDLDGIAGRGDLERVVGNPPDPEFAIAPNGAFGDLFADVDVEFHALAFDVDLEEVVFGDVHAGGGE